MYRHQENNFTIRKYNKTGNKAELRGAVIAIVAVLLVLAGVFVLAGFIDKYEAMQHELYAIENNCTWSYSYNGQEVCK